MGSILRTAARGALLGAAAGLLVALHCDPSVRHIRPQKVAGLDDTVLGSVTSMEVLG